jgi:acyl carrier protein
MDSAVIAQQVRSFIIENYLLDSQVTLANGDSFLQTGILDSTGVLELVAFLEEQYGITLEEGDLIPENLDSIDNILAYLSRKMKITQEQSETSATRVTAWGGNK